MGGRHIGITRTAVDASFLIHIDAPLAGFQMFSGVNSLRNIEVYSHLHGGIAYVASD